METRPYFLVGDLIANGFCGAVVGVIAALMVGPAWNSFVAMIVGMAVGMAVSLPIAFLFAPLFGAMEIMLPVMLTGMVSGMVVSMNAAMADTCASRGAGTGSLCGVGVVVAVWLANAWLAGRRSEWTS